MSSQEIKSNQGHEHYKEQGYVNVGGMRVRIRRDRVNRDFIYEYVVEDEIPVSFNESTLSNKFVSEIRNYMSRYGKPKLSRVAFFGTQADDYTSGKFFDDHDSIRRVEQFPGRDEPRFAFNWQRGRNMTWFTHSVGYRTVFEVVAEASSPSIPPPKFRVKQQVVFHTTVDSYVLKPDIQHEVIEQISWEECNDNDSKRAFIAKKSDLRDTDWLYKVRDVEYYFREEDLAGFYDMSMNTTFLKSVDYRTHAGQEKCEIFHVQDESFEALLKTPDVQYILKKTDLYLLRHLQEFDGITCGVRRINGSGSNRFQLKFARILPSIKYRRTPYSKHLKIAGAYESFGTTVVLDNMIDAVQRNHSWTLSAERSDIVIMLCLDMDYSQRGLKYIQITDHSFDEVGSFKLSVPFDKFSNKIPKSWIDKPIMRASTRHSDGWGYSEAHRALMPVLFYEISHLHSIEKRMVQINTAENIRQAKQLLIEENEREKTTSALFLRVDQRFSILDYGLEETIAALYDVRVNPNVQNTAIGTLKPSHYVLSELRVLLNNIKVYNCDLTKKFTRKVFLDAYNKFYNTAVGQVSSKVSVFNLNRQVKTATNNTDISGIFESLRVMRGPTMRPLRPRLMQEAFEKYLVEQAIASMTEQPQSGGESNEESKKEDKEPLMEAEEVIEFLKPHIGTYRLRF